MAGAVEKTDYKALYEQLLPIHQAILQGFGQQQQSNQTLLLDNKQLRSQLSNLQYDFHRLLKLLNGFKSERFIPPSIQGQNELGLVFEEAPEVISLNDVKKISYVKTKQPARDKQAQGLFPEYLRRETAVVEPDEDVSYCTRTGEKVVEKLAFRPGELYVNQTILPTYSCPVEGKPEQCREVQAKMPATAISKTIADNSLLAQVVVDKYIDHLPLNRQQSRYKRVSSVVLPISTLGDWVKLVAEAIEPLGDALLRVMLRHKYWQGDETTIKVLDSEVKKDTHTGYYWVYMTGDGRLIFYDYHRNRDGPAASHIIQKLKGHLQTDGYSVYESVAGEDLILLCCLAHARRKFFDTQGNDKARSEYVLAEIQKLYKIEQECREQHLSEDQIKEKRGKEAMPILEKLGQWMKKEYEQLRPKSLIAQALAYSIKRWDKLSLYATTGFLQIDNNTIERNMKNLGVGRKNYMFCGSHEAAKRAGILYSLLVTCKLNEVNPYEWLKDILGYDLQGYPVNKLEELLPHNWKKRKESLILEHTPA